MEHLFFKLAEEILLKNGIKIDNLKSKEVLELACSLVQASLLKKNEGGQKN